MAPVLRRWMDSRAEGRRGEGERRRWKRETDRRREPCSPLPVSSSPHLPFFSAATSSACPPTMPQAPAASAKAAQHAAATAGAEPRGPTPRRPASTGRRPPESPWLRRTPCDTWAGRAQVVVVHRRQIVVDQRIGMDHFDRAGGGHGRFDRRRTPLPPAAPASDAAACRGPAGYIASPHGAAAGSRRPVGSGHRARRRFAGRAARQFRQTGKNSLTMSSRKSHRRLATTPSLYALTIFASEHILKVIKTEIAYPSISIPCMVALLQDICWGLVTVNGPIFRIHELGPTNSQWAWSKSSAVCRKCPCAARLPASQHA